MEYTYPPTYNTQGWEEGLSLMSQGQFASTDVDAGNLSASYPLLAAEYPTQQTMAQHLYDQMPMVELYRPPKPAWASPLPHLGHTATGPSYIARNIFYRPPEPAWTLSLPHLGYMVAGASHVGGGDIYVSQQMLPAGGSYRQAAPIACEPADGESFLQQGPAPAYCGPSHAVQPQSSDVQLMGQHIASSRARQHHLKRESTLPMPSSQASMGREVTARTTFSTRRWRPILPRTAGTAPAQAGSFEGNTLDHATLTPRKSLRRKTPANRISPKAVKALGKGKSRARTATPVPRTGRKETPYLGAKHRCDPCRKGFGRKYERARHMKWGAAHRVGSIACDQCNKTFSRPDSLRNHQRAAHD
ncbi:hypothetical protein HETIRDRAFT_452629 [Heterobasidion irregulare TC 32-1]|uniref:C2H2-type domain-containing protein n=1 Tax=Heterobasidion irregulare (strain TC 32-1) TaxID=747525 RepID=W4K256_HETIT|nr:uncharacterized protein HETIRDRAFT_452629 [Heterobasidion irregulare TC 32-1]ETW79430.1 hypothetical protein HETIRDRAFT_452629 [Heterobasidion irregulare TC 32-1]